MIEFLFVIPVVVGIGLFLWLQAREKQRALAGQSRLAVWRLVIAAIAGLVMLFSGGCSLMLVPDAMRGNQYVDPIAILVVGGVPFAVGLFIWWLSLRRGNG